MKYSIRLYVVLIPTSGVTQNKVQLKWMVRGARTIGMEITADRRLPTADLFRHHNSAPAITTAQLLPRSYPSASHNPPPGLLQFFLCRNNALQDVKNTSRLQQLLGTWQGFRLSKCLSFAPHPAC